MDQYVISFEFDMLYFDMLELIDLIKESDNERLTPYIESLQEIVNKETV